jgi:hypothetical protein
VGCALFRLAVPNSLKVTIFRHLTVTGPRCPMIEDA